MPSFAIRPVTTALVAITTKPRLLSRLAMALAVACVFTQAPDGQAAAKAATHASTPHSAVAQTALPAVLKAQLRAAATDDKALLQAWYGARGFQPLWVTAAGLTPQGKAAMVALAQVGNEGLPPARYDLSALTPATRQHNAAGQAELEVALTIAVQTYLHDLRYGAANPHAPAFGIDGLTAVEKSGFTQAVAQARPSNPRYGQLSRKLKTARALHATAPQSDSAHAQVGETILALEKLRWDQNEGTDHAVLAQLDAALR